MVASEAFVRKHNLESQAVEIVAQVMTTDTSSTFEENSCMKMVSHPRLIERGKTKRNLQNIGAERCFLGCKRPGAP